MQQIMKKNVKHIQLHCKFDVVVVFYYHLITYKTYLRNHVAIQHQAIQSC